MPQDAYTMRAAAAELNGLLAGGKVNKIIQPRAEEIVVGIYTGDYIRLAVSANARLARVCPTRLDSPSPKVAPGFCMLLRKHLSGAVVKAVECVGSERVMLVRFTASNDFAEPVEKVLVAEVMGKYSNVVLLEGGKILGTLRPAFGDIDGARVLLTGLDYTLPPPQDKADLCEKTRVLGGFLNFSGPASNAVAAIVKGVSTKTAKEAAVRFFGSDAPIDAEKAAGFYDFLVGFLSFNSGRACVTDGPGADFFADDYISVECEKRYFSSLVEAETFFFDREESAAVVAAKTKQITDKIKASEKKLNKKLALLIEKELDAGDAEVNRIKGELLTSFAYAVPAGAESCELANYYSENGETVKISLDKNLSAVKNAQAYFKKYRKQKKALEAVAGLKAEVEAELGYVASLKEELGEAETAEDLDFIIEEMKAAGMIRSEEKRKKQAPSMPKTFEKGGFLIRSGRNNLQNDALTFGSGRSDLWLHTKDFHSAHVIIETGGREVPDDVLLAAAEICAYNSKARLSDKVPVDYCRKRFVKKPSGARPGRVIYTDFKTVIVTPNPHDELKK